MTALKLSLFSLGGLALATAGAFGVARAATERVDCPGKITCPVTGEIICRDQCPTIDPQPRRLPGPDRVSAHGRARLRRSMPC